MPTQDERRRYFRIDDTVGLRYTRIGKSQADAREKELVEGDSGHNRLQLAEKSLQMLIDKLRVQSPEFAEAIELLNTKFNLLKEEQLEQNSGGRGSHVRQVSISACGVAFDDRDQFKIGDILDIDITLLPTDLHIFTLGEVVDCRASEEASGEWATSVDFYAMPEEDEELMVQHIVKRQGRILAARRRSAED